MPETTTVPTATHTYTSPGIYTISLVVHSDGLDSIAATQQVIINFAPIALFTGTVLGLVASLDGSTSFDQVASRSIVGYSWDFGDGSPVDTSGATVTHAYAGPGPYTAILTVTDDQGETSLPTSHVVTLGGDTWDDTALPVTWGTITATAAWDTVTPTDLQSEGSVV